MHHCWATSLSIPPGKVDTMQHKGAQMCRLNDSSANWAQFRFAPNNTVGKYQPTPGQTAALYPQLANTTTFVTPLASEWYPERFASYQPAQVAALTCIKLPIAIQHSL